MGRAGGMRRSAPAVVLVCSSISLVLSGCSFHKTTTTTTTTTVPTVQSIWAWRPDVEFGVQTTYDLSKDQSHSIYGACWLEHSPETLGEHEVQDQITFVELSGESGVTLFNKRLTKEKPGCIMRKSRVPIDLSQIGRIEMEIDALGSSNTAPWYSVWLVPMLYSVPDASEKAAEIDLVENYDYQRRGSDMDSVKSVFANCDPTIPGHEWTRPFCKSQKWNAHGGNYSRHLTLSAKERGPQEGRVIEVRHCERTSSTCSAGDAAFIKVTRPPQNYIPDWFPIWNRTAAGDRYAHYWLVIDMWWTSETDFKLSVDHVKFFFDNGTEWKMPLTGDALRLRDAVADEVDLVV